MALRWIEGFDHATITTVYERTYTGANTLMPASFSKEAPAMDRGTTSEAIFDGCASEDDAVLHTPDLVAAPENSWIVGFAFRSDTGGTSGLENGVSPHIGFHNSAGEQLRIEVYDFTPAAAKPGGIYYGWRIMRGATEIARTNELFLANLPTDEAWIYFQFKVTIDNAAGSVEGRFQHMQKSSRNVGGGHTALTWDAAVSSIDTQEQATTGVDSLVIGFDTGSPFINCSFDDFYACDSTGAKNNDYLGMCFVTPHHITVTGGGDGDTVDWTLATATSTEDALQEPTGTVEDDDRLTSDTVGQIHLAAMQGLDAMADASIIGVRYDLHGRMETTGALDIGFMWRKTTATAAQIEHGTALPVASTTVVAATVIAEDDPNTATDWVFADVDTLQLGIKNNG